VITRLVYDKKDNSDSNSNSNSDNDSNSDSNSESVCYRQYCK
jgi:hypothetical protein